MTRRCWQCGAEWTEKTQPGMRETCLGCDAALYCCRNCRFYDADASEWCREPMARDRKPRDTEAPNTCDYFLFGEFEDGDARRSREANAMEALDALFGGAPSAPPAEEKTAEWMKTEPETKRRDDLFSQ